MHAKKMKPLIIETTLLARIHNNIMGKQKNQIKLLHKGTRKKKKKPLTSPDFECFS
jgi:hypothetical protein